MSELLERRERTLVRLLLLGHLLLGVVRLLLLGHLLLGGHCARGKLPDVVHHGGALLRRGHCHGELLSELRRRLLPRILRWVVGDGRPLLLLLLAMGGGGYGQLLRAGSSCASLPASCPSCWPVWCLGCGQVLICCTLHSCGHLQRHRHACGSSSNSHTTCRAWDAQTHSHRFVGLGERLVVVGSRHHCR